MIDIHQAKTHLSRLIDEAAKGDAFIIAKAGRPVVKVVPLEGATATPPQRIGFMKGQFSVPDDFDTVDAEAIRGLFEGEA